MKVPWSLMRHFLWGMHLEMVSISWSFTSLGNGTLAVDQSVSSGRCTL